MSLRAVPARLFVIVCDTCGLETARAQMPVEAEVRAAEGGWRAEKNPLRHACPWCVQKATGTKTAAPADQLAGRAEARLVTGPATPTAGR